MKDIIKIGSELIKKQEIIETNQQNQKLIFFKSSTKLSNLYPTDQEKKKQRIKETQTEMIRNERGYNYWPQKNKCYEEFYSNIKDELDEGQMPRKTETSKTDSGRNRPS